MRRRLARLDETRQRITAAAFELHATIGPSRTTTSAIADRAGVQRRTVSRHFPDLDSLYEACTAHGLRVTGVPQPASWVAVPDPVARLRLGLAEMYVYYRANQRMLNAIFGDAAGMAEPPVAPDLFDRHMAQLLAALTEGWPCADGSRAVLDAVIAHAISFGTWRSLTGSGLSDDEAGELLVRVAVAVARGTL